MKYQVWYMRPSWFHEGIMGQAKPDPANLEATHVHLREVEIDAEEAEEGLDRVYSIQQAHNWALEWEATNALLDSKGLRHTSMSVGDVIVDDAGKVWVVAPFGFHTLSKE
jgi:hypothetical protein